MEVVLDKIIKLDPTRKKPESVSPGKSRVCDHKHVIAYTVFRTVRCSTCGTLLDPFDVLVDMLKGCVPSDTNRLGGRRLDEEMKKRSRDKFNEDKPSSE